MIYSVSLNLFSNFYFRLKFLVAAAILKISSLKISVLVIAAIWKISVLAAIARIMAVVNIA